MRLGECAGSAERRNVPWWPRSQRIRTAGEVPLETVLLDPDDAPAYQQIAAKAVHLRELGMTLTDIGRALGVSRFVVRKAVHWLGRVGAQHHEATPVLG